MPTTSPDNLWSPENTDNFEDLVPDLSTMQGSVQAALSSRAIRTYKWADTAARNAQTGMTEGDIGYQLDNDIYYSYTGGSWSLLSTGQVEASGISYAAGWTSASDGFGIYRHDGRLYFEGSLTRTAAGSLTGSMQTAVTFPTGFRPVATTRIPVSHNLGQVFIECILNTTGTLQLRTLGTTTALSTNTVITATGSSVRSSQ